MPSPSPSPLPSSSKQTFVMRDQALPLAEQIQRTRDDLYEHFAELCTLHPRVDQILELLQGYGPRLTNLEASMDRLTNLEASMDTQHEQITALADMSQRIIQHLETTSAPPQPSTAPANQNGT